MVLRKAKGIINCGENERNDGPSSVYTREYVIELVMKSRGANLKQMCAWV